LLKHAWEKYRGFGDKEKNANRAAAYNVALTSDKGAKQAAFEAKDLILGRAGK